MSKSVKLGAIVCSVAAIIAIVQQNYSNEIRINKEGLNITGNAEGCRRDPYRCPADVITFGVGSTETDGLKIDVNHIYTDQEIAERWVRGLKIAQQCIDDNFNGKLMTSNQFSAMSSLAFNLGCRNIQRYYSKKFGKYMPTTIYKYAQNKQFEMMCDRIPDFNKSAGKVLAGLVKRRQQERALCLKK